MNTSFAETLEPKTALHAGNFRRIAERGFGDGCNSYAYSSVWFGGHLYVGTVRNVLPVIAMRWPFEVKFEVPPVPTPADYTELDLRGQIWRYNPATGEWRQVYRSPMAPGYGGTRAPVAVAFRSMTQFQGKNDPQPAIYTLPIVGRNSLGSVTLRSFDGVHYEQLPPPRLAGEVERFGSFRAVAPFKGRLFVAPSHTKGDPTKTTTQANVTDVVEVRCSEEPASGIWQASSPRYFGDPTNVVVFDMAACGDFLYAGVGNIREGFQLWRTTAEGDPPHHWEKVLDRGADRGPLNQAPISFAEFQGDLYLGTAIQNGGWDRTNNLGPAAAEVIRVHPDKTWDLVVGEPRMTRQGLKVPTSGLGAGFDNPLGVYMWRMCAHEGALYVGTHDLSTFTIYADRTRWPERVRRMLQFVDYDQFLRFRGGFDLWRTTDGDNWVPVTQNGFQHPLNYGVRAMTSTPHGLFIGTANPFGPTVAVKSPSGWRYENNPRGGLEVYLGSHRHTRVEDQPPSEVFTIWGHSKRPSRDLRSAAEGNRDGERELSINGARHRNHHTWDCGQFDPLLCIADVDKELWGLGVSVDDLLNEYFGGSLRNAGFWSSENVTPREASAATLAELIALLPPQVQQQDRLSVLLIGDRIDGLANEIPNCLSTDSIHGVVFDRVAAKHLRELRQQSNLTVHVAKRGRLRFKRDSYDLTIWIEGPSRVGSLRSALRAVHGGLKAGGYLLSTDLLGAETSELVDRSPADQNCQELVAGYREALQESGFRESQVIDVIKQGWQQFHQHSREFFMTRLMFQQIDNDLYEQTLAGLPGGSMAVAAHVMIVARKQREGESWPAE